MHFTSTRTAWASRLHQSNPKFMENCHGLGIIGTLLIELAGGSVFSIAALWPNPDSLAIPLRHAHRTPRLFLESSSPPNACLVDFLFRNTTLTLVKHSFREHGTGARANSACEFGLRTAEACRKTCPFLLTRLSTGRSMSAMPWTSARQS